MNMESISSSGNWTSMPLKGGTKEAKAKTKEKTAPSTLNMKHGA
jgi:hypothetical protein